MPCEAQDDEDKITNSSVNQKPHGTRRNEELRLRESDDNERRGTRVGAGAGTRYPEVQRAGGEGQVSDMANERQLGQSLSIIWWRRPAMRASSMRTAGRRERSTHARKLQLQVELSSTSVMLMSQRGFWAPVTTSCPWILLATATTTTSG
jgi:hypothetical protein